MKKHSLKTTFTFIVVFLSIINSTAQKYINKSDISERVLMQTDNETYVTGEKILFNLMIIDNLSNIPSYLSKIIYVELYNQDNIPIVQKKYYTNDASVTGDIEIPRNVKSDYYYIRAYTNFMKNIGCEIFYTKKIRIINPFGIIAKYENSVKYYLSPFDLKFFPEGGKFIPDFNNKTAVRITDANLQGVPSMVRITDNENNIILSFQTDKNGYGLFDFAPESGKTYKIEFLSESQFYSKNIEISDLNDAAIEIKDKDKNSFVVNIKTNNKTLFPYKLTANILGNEYLLKSEITDTKDIVINKNNLPDGLITINLFDKENSLISSRNIFSENSVNIEISTDKNGYIKRDNSEINFKTEQNNSNEKISFFYKISEKPDFIGVLKISDNIKTSLYNSQNPTLLMGEYRQSSSEIIKDIFLLINSAETINNSKVELKYLPEIKSDLISGTITDLNSNAQANKLILQAFLGKAYSLNSTFTGDDGKFYFENMFYGNNNIILRTENNENLTFNIDKEFYTKFLSIEKQNIQIDSSEIEQIRNRTLYVQLKDAYMVKDTVSVTDNTKAFYGNDFILFNTDNYIQLPLLEEFLYDVVHDVYIFKNGSKTNVEVISQITKRKIGDKPLYILDGVPIFDSKYVLSIPLKNIEKVKIVNEKYYYQRMIFDGIIDIETKTENASIIELPSYFLKNEFTGLSKQTDIINTLDSNNSDLPNFTNNLLFKKYVSSENINNISEKINMPDNEGEFIIECIGISENGKFYYGTKTVNVK